MSTAATGKQPLRVMVVDDNLERGALVEQSLHDQGVRVVALLTSASGLLNQIEQHRPDVIVVDLESPDRDVLESLGIVSKHNPTPIVMFSEQDDPSFVAAAVDSGVTAYQGYLVRPELVKPIIEAAMAQFERFESLRMELQATRTELEENRIVERAKSLLSQHRGIDAESAYGLIRKLSMDTNKRVPDVARTVVATLETPEEDQDAV